LDQGSSSSYVLVNSIAITITSAIAIDCKRCAFGYSTSTNSSRLKSSSYCHYDFGVVARFADQYHFCIAQQATQCTTSHCVFRGFEYL
jgi:hypothetical protein